MMKNHVLIYIANKKIDLLLLLLIFLIALFPRLFLYHTEFWRTPDGIGYINIARNINAGNGLTKSLKMSFYDESPVVTSAIKEQPVLTPVLFSFLLRINDDPYFLQAFGLVIMAVNCALFFYLARHFYPPLLSFLAALLLALNPNILITNRFVFSEPIFLLFVLLFFLAFYYLKKTLGRYGILGILGGLAYLTRLEGMFLLLMLLVTEYKQYRLLLLSFLAFTLTALPYFILNYHINHNPFYTFTSYHFRVHHFSEYIWNGYGKVFPTPLAFIMQNTRWVITAVTTLFIENIRSLSGFGFLSALTLVYLLRFKEITKRFAPLLLFSFFVIGTFSLIWSQFTEPERHFTPIFPLLLLPVFVLFEKPRLKRLGYVLFTITFLLYLVFDIHRINWARTQEPKMDNWGMEDKKAAYGWVRNNVDKQAIIATPNPPLTYLFTERPVIILPDFKTNQELENFVKKYQVSYILSPRDERDHSVNYGKAIFEDGTQIIYHPKDL